MPKKVRAPEMTEVAALPLWTRFSVTWTFVSNLYGQTPADPEIVRSWVDARKPAAVPPQGRPLVEIAEEVMATLAEPPEDMERKSLLVFQRDPTTTGDQRPIVFRAETIRAHLKDCARQVSAMVTSRLTGERAFSTRVINGVYLPLTQRWVPLQGPNGQAITEIHGYLDRPVRNARTNTTALKRLEYIAPPVSITFELQVLGKSATVSDLHMLMDYGGVHGYGGERSMDGGKYLVTNLKEVIGS
jgi:hypothetical protein